MNKITQLTLVAALALSQACATAGAKPVGQGVVWPEQLDHASSPETHKQAALDLLSAMPLDATMQATIDSMLNTQLNAQPAMRVVEPEMRAFFAKYLSAAALREPMAELYIQHFSELELRQTLAFYQTKTGQRVLMTMPQLVQEGAAIGVRTMQEHQGELEAAIKAKLGAQQE